MKFSQRIGKKEAREALQPEDIDQILENRLWNNILNDFIQQLSDYNSGYGETDRVKILIYIWENFFEFKSDEIPSLSNEVVYTDGVIELKKKMVY